jgi:hypothetical protein
MNHVRKPARRELERANVPHVQPDGGVARQVRRLLRERLWVSCQHHRLGAQTKPVVCPGEALQQPAAEEARAARDEDALAAQLIPQALGVGQDVIEVVC